MIYASFGALILLSVGFTAGTPELADEPTDKDVLESVEMDKDPYMGLGEYDLQIALTDSAARNASEVQIKTANGNTEFTESLEASETSVEWTAPSVGKYTLIVVDEHGERMKYKFEVTNQINELIP